MTGQPAVTRADLLAMLAELGDRAVADVPDRIGSMELAWLVHRVEQRTGRPLDIDDERVARIRTVADAEAVFTSRASLLDLEIQEGRPAGSPADHDDG